MSTESPAPLRVLVADPHPCVREGVKAILGSQPNVHFVGEAGNGHTALALTKELHPDLAVIESIMPGLDGPLLTALLSRALKVLVLTACEHVASLQLLVYVGASGIVLKCSPKEQLVDAFRAVAAGGTFIDPRAGWLLAGTIANGRPPAPGSSLSEREVWIMHLVALGYANKAIALRLKVSIKTLEAGKKQAMEKLNARTRADVVRWAINHDQLCVYDFPDAASDHQARSCDDVYSADS